MSDEKFQKFLAVLIAVVTVFTALIAQLESEAGANDDRAGRDAKQASVAAFGLQIRGNAESNYAYYTAFEQYREMETLRLAAQERGDQKTADRYELLQDSLLSTSPLLSGKDSKGKPFFDSVNEWEPDLERYEAETYFIEVQRDLQNFKAASVVKDGWDEKANAYVFHLTLLAVSLFLFGLAATIATAATRMIFTGSGLAIAAVALMAAFTTYAKPVPDLREKKGAIEYYAQGMGLVHQARLKEAVAEFDQAITASPDYADAFLERGRAYLYQEKPDLAKAQADLQNALKLDPSNSAINTELAWAQYSLGDFAGADKTCDVGLAAASDNLQLQFMKGLGLLASGKATEADASMSKSLDQAATTVAEAAKAGEQPPSEVFAILDEASGLLDGLQNSIDSKKGTPPADKVGGKPEEVSKACEKLSAKLVSWELSLENTGKPPQGTLTAKLSDESFEDISKEDKPFTPEDNVFKGSPKQIAMNFHFDGMKKGQKVLFRVFLDGEELDSWRYQETWEDDGSGEWGEPLYPGYSESFRFEPGNYYVEVFVDYQLAVYGNFTVEGDSSEGSGEEE